MFTLDISKYQGATVDFKALKGQVDLIILRDQYGYTIKDEQYDNYVQGCRSNGIPFNTYAFFDAASVTDAQAEAASDIQRMAKDSVVAWIDIETVSVKSGKDADLVAAGNAYYDALKKAGFQKVGLYSGEYFYNQHSLSQVKTDCLWIAKYNANDGVLDLSKRPAVDCDLWQYTSAGKLNGIPGVVDLSVLVGAKPLSYFTGAAPVLNPPVFGKVAHPQAKAVSVANNDIRKAPSHNSEIVRNTLDKESFDVYDIVDNEGDTWYNVGGANWICSNHLANAHITEVLAPPPVVEPVPTPAPPAPAEVHVNFIVTGLKGGSLGTVHEYIADKQYWFTIVEEKDGTMTLETGIFIQDSKSYSFFKDLLDTEKIAYTTVQK